MLFIRLVWKHNSNNEDVKTLTRKQNIIVEYEIQQKRGKLVTLRTI